MKTLERKYSKSDRILCKAKFSAWVFLKELFLTIFLGGILAVIWIFGTQIECFFTKGTEAYVLNDYVLRWVALGIGAFCLFCALMEYIQLYSKELILTEDKIAVREGVLSVKNIIIPISEIKIIETNQNAIQRLFGIGDLMIVSDAEKPYTIKGIKQADRLSRRIMKQMADIKRDSDKKIKIQLTGSSK